MTMDRDHECTCDQEMNALGWCPHCGQLRFLLRDPRRLEPGNIYAYDPWCGYSLAIPAAEEGPSASPEG